MPTSTGIRILEKEANRRGDLFGRLMADLFLALGYENVRLNIHKSGREVDVEAEHRTEPRRVIAECKATSAKTGGDAINKFVGTLDVEKRKESDVETVGYFISLTGFKETALEQEKEVGGRRVILLTGNQVVEKLIRGRIIVSRTKAMERAGRCAAEKTGDLRPEEDEELLAHEIGWIWVIYFEKDKLRTHFALIHADGEAIARPLAETIIKADKSVGGSLHSLTYLPPTIEDTPTQSDIARAQAKYFQYLADECGEIPLEGLPADQDVGSLRLRLENIFVPLHLVPCREYGPSASTSRKEEPKEVAQPKRESVGRILSKCSRLAILAAPGGGKTTLLKRLAIAYAFPDRRKQILDRLPDRSWLPLFIRCRQIDALARSPITKILGGIPQRAEMGDLAQPFMRLVSQALRSGRVLLLIDGLDEISEEGARLSFVNQLRTFLATYATVDIVVTSREAGFRIVGGGLSSHCVHYKIADFDNEDIRRLTLAWHKEVVGDKPQVRSDAKKLAKTISDSDRVRRLAKNPLLLTTLLLVKRWVGQLPTRRTVLYGKALEVLLMTWNVAGYDPIDQDEAVPQLAFVAFTMMKDGVQRISARRLSDILIRARKQMPEVLGYARLSVAEFIQRVELRSSLLIMTGYEIEEGTQYPMYEFRHLTFQEYLAARAIVDGYYPGRRKSDTLLTLLEPHLTNQDWKEVIGLAAVLAGRNARTLVRRLIELCKESAADESFELHVTPLSHLRQCFLDEIQVAPGLLEEGLEWVARRGSLGARAAIHLLLEGKYGTIQEQVVRRAFFSSDTDLNHLGYALGITTLKQLKWSGPRDLTPQRVDRITALLQSSDPIQRTSGAMAVMQVAFEMQRAPRRYTPQTRRLLKVLGDQLVPVLQVDEFHHWFAACWAFAWLGEGEAWNPKGRPNFLSRLLLIWREAQLPEVADKARWAISALPIIDRGSDPLPKPDPKLISFIKKEFRRKERFAVSASLTAAFYCKAPWDDRKLAELVISKGVRPSRLESLLKALGQPGKAQLRALKQRLRTGKRAQKDATKKTAKKTQKRQRRKQS